MYRDDAGNDDASVGDDRMFNQSNEHSIKNASDVKSA